MSKACSLAECDRQGYACGLCYAHYYRQKKYGNPYAGRTPRGDCLKFIDAAISGSTDECVIWPYATSVDGRAQVRISGRLYTVSRLVCERAHGAMPRDKEVAAHSCGNGSNGCVNPRHLRWATQRENMGDCLLHGTRNRGERNGSAKLSVEAVLEIRQQVASGTLDKIALAKTYGVLPGAIESVVSGKTWAWLERRTPDFAHDQRGEAA